MMQVDSLKIELGLKNERVSAKKKWSPNHPPDLFPLHTLAAFIGSRGSGKTNACVLLAQRYCQFGSFNRIFLISPTYESNNVWKTLPIEPEDIYEDALQAQQALHSILEKKGLD